MGDIESRAASLGLTVPPAPSPKGSYLPFVRVGDLLFTSGVGPVRSGTRIQSGYVGDDVSLEQAREAARVAVLNALGIVREALGTLDRVRQIVRLTGYVRSAPGFIEQADAVDAASRVIVWLFGDRG